MSKGVISWPVKDFSKFSILAKFLLAKGRPILGIQLPNVGDDNQSCHILTVIFDKIHWLWVPKYNVYSSILFYKNLLISTSFRGCGSVFSLHMCYFYIEGGD